MITRVLLVDSNTEIAPYPVSPLGLCRIATATEKAGYETKVFDGFNDNGSFGKEGFTTSLINLLNSFQPHVIGVSVRNIDDIVMQNSKFYIDEIEQFCIQPIKDYGNAITVLGGAGYSLYPDELLRRWNFDYGIAGPGENIFVQLLNTLKANEAPLKIPGMRINSRHSGLINNNTQDLVKPVRNKEKMQVPHANIDEYLNYKPYQQRSSYPIQTKRGCALKCLYCSYPAIEGNTYQLREVKDIVDEIESVMKRMERVTFEFVDSTFNHPLDHAEAVCKEIIQRGLKIRLRTMGMNPAWITPNLLSLMKQAGFTQIDCTPDSASDKMLINLRKGFNRKKLKEVTEMLKDADMPTMWFFILGGPGENIETLNESIDFIDQFIDERDLVHITEGLRVYPQTGLADKAIEEGLISPKKSLLAPYFYVSPQISPQLLEKKLREFTATHHNCLRSVDSTPSKEMIGKAVELRKREGLMNEPMFRSLLRVRKAEMLLQ